MAAAIEEYREDNAEAYVMYLTPKISLRLTKFFDRTEFIGKTTSDVMEIMMDLVDTHPDMQIYRIPLRPLKRIGGFPTAAASQEYLKRQAMDENVTSPPPSAPKRARIDIRNKPGPASRKNRFMTATERENAQAIMAISGNVDMENTTENYSSTHDHMYGNNTNIYEGTHYGQSQNNAAENTTEPTENLDEPESDNNAEEGGEEDEQATSGPIKRKTYLRGTGSKFSVITSKTGYLMYDVVMKRQRNCRLQCHLCRQWMTCANAKTGYLACRYAFSHVCTHFGKMLWKCKLCGFRAVNEDRLRGHLTGVHKTAGKHLMVDFIDRYETQLKEMITKCFDWECNEDPPDAPPGRRVFKRQGNEVILRNIFEKDALRLLVEKCIPNWQVDGALYCRLCGRWTHVAGYLNGYRVQAVIDHVCRHVNKPLFECDMCHHRVVTLAQIRRHMDSRHGLILTNFTKHSDDAFQQELKAMAVRCFDRSSENDMRPEDDGKYKMEMERLACLRYFRAVATSNMKNGVLRCRLCGYANHTTTRQPYARERGFNHVIEHLELNMYFCRLCPKVCSKHSAIATHVKSKHKCRPTTAYEERMGLFKTEIFDMIRKCYDASYSPEEPAVAAAAAVSENQDNQTNEVS